MGRRSAQLFVLISCLVSSAALATPWRLHGTGVLAHAITAPQKDDLSIGAGVLPALEYKLFGRLGLQFELSALGLFAADSEVGDDRVAAGDDAAALGFGLGIRVRPMEKEIVPTRGLWLSSAIGGAATGSFTRPMINFQAGYDFELSGKIGWGPVLGLYRVFQPNSRLRPEDANVVLVGVHGVLSLFGSGGSKSQASSEELGELVEEEDGSVPVGLLSDPQPGDRDRDGLDDGPDQGLDEPEDVDGFDDQDDRPDADGDGVKDFDDHCPNEPETVNGFEDDDGCPDSKKARLVGKEIVLESRIRFDTNRAVVLPESYELLSAVAQLIMGHLEFDEVSIEGHTDARGLSQHNQELSERRARAVKDFLVEAGVNPDRLSVVGFGESRPRNSEGDGESHGANRRVEFRVKSSDSTGG